MAQWAGPFNVAAPEHVSMRTLAEALGRHLNVSPQYQLHPERKALRITPDLSRLASVCDVTRLRDIQSGLAALFPYESRTLGEYLVSMGPSSRRLEAPGASHHSFEATLAAKPA
jgi:hypothetical protein